MAQTPLRPTSAIKLVWRVSVPSQVPSNSFSNKFADWSTSHGRAAGVYGVEGTLLHAPKREFDELADAFHLAAAAPDLVVAHLVQPVVILTFDWLA